MTALLIAFAVFAAEVAGVVVLVAACWPRWWR